MSDLDLSIIIPTYNRKDTLAKCLESIEKSNCQKEMIEVIIADDGSTDETELMVNELSRKLKVKIKFFRQENKGPAAARNLAIRNSSGKLLLIIGDDIILTPTMIEEHLKWHKQYSQENYAVLGYVTWSPDIRITPFMKWSEEGGPQFNYHLIKNKIEVEEWFFFTCNVSVKKKFIVESGLFNERFRYAAYEDTELADRLKKKGMKLLFNINAQGYHSHYTTLRQSCRRMIKVGESDVLLSQLVERRKRNYVKHSALRMLLNTVKFIPFYIAALCLENIFASAFIFNYVLGYYHNIGIQKALRDQ